MRNYQMFGVQESMALNDFLAGRSVDSYEDAVLYRVLNHMYDRHSGICRAVVEGAASESEATTIYQAGMRLAELIKIRGRDEAFVARSQANHPPSKALQRALDRVYRPTIWQRLFG